MEGRRPSYAEAYARARAELDATLTDIGFRRIFDTTRLAAPDSLRAARRLIAAAGNVLGTYRSRERELEDTYHPGEPDAPGSLRETFATAEGTRALLADSDSLFGLLLAQVGNYTLSREGLRFTSRPTAQAYADLRNRIVTSIQRWQDSAQAPNRMTMPLLLRTVGPTPPPARR
jgi:hypothetical protein